MQAEMHCTQCGAKIEPTSRFCSSCGKPTSLAATTNSNNEDQTRKEKEAKQEINTTSSAIPPTQRRREGRDLPRSYTKMTDEEYYYNYRDASGAWYLLPIFIGFIGGIIMWLALRNEDPLKAKYGIYVGIISSALGFIFLLFIASLASASAYNSD